MLQEIWKLSKKVEFFSLSLLLLLGDGWYKQKQCRLCIGTEGVRWLSLNVVWGKGKEVMMVSGRLSLTMVAIAIAHQHQEERSDDSPDEWGQHTLLHCCDSSSKSQLKQDIYLHHEWTGQFQFICLSTICKFFCSFFHFYRTLRLQTHFHSSDIPFLDKCWHSSNDGQPLGWFTWQNVFT